VVAAAKLVVALADNNWYWVLILMC